MPTKSSIIFDTSGLNALADDPEARPIVTSLNMGFWVRLSERSICEIAATSDTMRRTQLLDLCRYLVHAGEVMLPLHVILRYESAIPFWCGIAL